MWPGVPRPWTEKMPAMLKKASARKTNLVSRRDCVMLPTTTNAKADARAVPETIQKWKVGSISSGSQSGRSIQAPKTTIGTARSRLQPAHQRAPKLTELVSAKLTRQVFHRHRAGPSGAANLTSSLQVPAG